MAKQSAKRVPAKAPVKKIAKRPIYSAHAKPAGAKTSSAPASKLDLIIAALKAPKGASIVSGAPAP